MDFNSRLESLDIAISEDIFQKVGQVAKAMYSTIATNADKTKTRIKLPPEEECDREVLALAIERLLSKFFKISPSSKALMKIKDGKSVKFRSKAQDDLPPLTILVVLDPEKRQQMIVQGVVPQNGVNGYSDLTFHWQQESGVVDKHGNIDLKKINKLPGVKKGALLARIHQHTYGSPGISSFGKRLRQSSGIPIKVKWDEESIAMRNTLDDQGNVSTFKLYAQKGGIVQFSLERENNPKTLSRIAINDTVVINGDVDYGVGDQGEIEQPELGCESNIVIEGSVRGVFTIQSNGYVQVKNAIEGTVAANEVDTALITGGSCVSATKGITAGSIVNASAKAQTITVKENTNGSTLDATGGVTFEENVTCMSLNVNTNKLQAKSTKFSGVCCFTLGKGLFSEVEDHVTKLKKINKKIKELSGPLKDIAEAIADHLNLLNTLVRKGPANKLLPEAIQILDKIKATIATGFLSVEKSIDESIVPAAYRLQAILGESKFDEGVLRKVDVLIKNIAFYNQKEKEVAPYVKEKGEHEAELVGLRSKITNDLVMHFTNIEFVSESAELRVSCGEAEKVFSRQDVTQNTFTVQYKPPEEGENLRKGKLVVS